MLTDFGTAVVYRVGTDWKGAGGDLLGDENDLQLEQSVGYCKRTYLPQNSLNYILNICGMSPSINFNLKSLKKKKKGREREGGT